MINKNNVLSGEDIKNIFAQIKTPEYSPKDDVLKKIKQKNVIKQERKTKKFKV